MKKRMLALTLAALLLFGASGCGSNEPQKPDAAMGRYVETELAFPDKTVWQVMGLQSRLDGTVELLCYSGDGEPGLHWYRSADGGATWSEQLSPQLEQSFSAIESNSTIDTACWDEAGRLYVKHSDYSAGENGESEVKEGVAVLDGGALTRFDWPIPGTDDGSAVQAMRVAENGDLLLGGWAEIQQVDRDTGVVKHSYRPKSSEDAIDGWDVAGNTLWLSEGEGLRGFDLTTGKKGELLKATASTQDGANYGSVYRMVNARPDGVYYADEHGLYRALAGSSVSERLIDGGMSALGTPSVDRIALTATPDGFLFLGFAAEAYRLYSYRFDPDVPTFAANELRVWSLRDDPLVRQAMGAFQKTHSDVYVSYESAMAEGSAVTRDDALKSLATELVAGKGPDVLVLDGVPLQSYIDKGVLTDLSGTVKPLMDDGTLLGNIAGAYGEEGGAMYAVPALFEVPMIQADGAALTTVGGIADWAERNKGSFVHPMNACEPEDYLRLFYPLAPATDEAGLRALLSDLKRIYDVERAKPFDDMMNSELSFQFSALHWSVGNIGLNVGNLQQFENLYAAWQVGQDRQRGTIGPLFDTDGFLPRSVLGLAAQSKQAGLGAEFIKTMLSEEVQASKVGVGMAVNAAAYAAGTEQDEESIRYSSNSFSTYGTTLADAQGAEVPVYVTIHYPPQAWRDEMAQRFRSLKTPLTFDETVLQLMIDNTGGYFDGKSTLDETMKTLMQKLELYRSEQGT